MNTNIESCSELAEKPYSESRRKIANFNIVRIAMTGMLGASLAYGAIELVKNVIDETPIASAEEPLPEAMYSHYEPQTPSLRCIAPGAISLNSIVYANVDPLSIGPDVIGVVRDGPKEDSEGGQYCLYTFDGYSLKDQKNIFHNQLISGDLLSEPAPNEGIWVIDKNGNKVFKAKLTGEHRIDESNPYFKQAQVKIEWTETKDGVLISNAGYIGIESFLPIDRTSFHYDDGENDNSYLEALDFPANLKGSLFPREFKLGTANEWNPQEIEALELSINDAYRRVSLLLGRNPWGIELVKSDLVFLHGSPGTLYFGREMEIKNFKDFQKNLQIYKGIMAHELGHTYMVMWDMSSAQSFANAVSLLSYGQPENQTWKGISDEDYKIVQQTNVFMRLEKENPGLFKYLVNRYYQRTETDWWISKQTLVDWVNDYKPGLENVFQDKIFEIDGGNASNASENSK